MHVKWTLVANETERKDPKKKNNNNTKRTKNSASAFMHISSGLEFSKVSCGWKKKYYATRNCKNCEL